MTLNLEPFLLQLNVKIDAIIESLHESCERLSVLETKVSDDISKRKELDLLVKEKEIAVLKITDDYRGDDRHKQNIRFTVMGLLIAVLSTASSVIITLSVK